MLGLKIDDFTTEVYEYILKTHSQGWNILTDPETDTALSIMTYTAHELGFSERQQAFDLYVPSTD